MWKKEKKQDMKNSRGKKTIKGLVQKVNIKIIHVPKRKNRKTKGAIKKVIQKFQFWELEKKKKASFYFERAHQTPSTMNKNRLTYLDITEWNFLNTVHKEKILQLSKEKTEQFPYKRSKVRMVLKFSRQYWKKAGRQ